MLALFSSKLPHMSFLDIQGEKKNLWTEFDPIIFYMVSRWFVKVRPVVNPSLIVIDSLATWLTPSMKEYLNAFFCHFTLLTRWAIWVADKKKFPKIQLNTCRRENIFRQDYQLSCLSWDVSIYQGLFYLRKKPYVTDHWGVYKCSEEVVGLISNAL